MLSAVRSSSLMASTSSSWAVIGLVAVALVPAGPARAQTHPHDRLPEMLHVGNEAPYPSMGEASRANRRKARKLRLASLRAAARFDSVQKATELGYIVDPNLSPLYTPGLQHLRRNGVSSSGRRLYAPSPHALVFWCPSIGDCRLAALMYRVPPRGRPPTYGGLVGWHRHAVGWSWMTHVWLTATTRTSLAQCAPFKALRDRDPLLIWEPYQADVPMIDEPCPDTAGISPPPGP
jgi:hypothetical protein